MTSHLDLKRGIYIGTGAGLLLFVLLGFFPSAMIGGFLGMKLAELILGPASMGILARILSALSMIGAVVFTGIIFIFGGAYVGYNVYPKVAMKIFPKKA